MGIRKVSDRMTPSLRDIQKELKRFPKLAYDFFVGVTPRDKGNARNRTKLQGSKINADYPYAKPLDKGHSKQAPRGMTEPTIEYLKKQAKTRIKK
jgi:hypothetical protein